MQVGKPNSMPQNLSQLTPQQIQQFTPQQRQYIWQIQQVKIFLSIFGNPGTEVLKLDSAPKQKILCLAHNFYTQGHSSSTDSSQSV